MRNTYVTYKKIWKGTSKTDITDYKEKQFTQEGDFAIPSQREYYIWNKYWEL